MIYVYAAIASTLWLILLITVNPFKKHVSSYALIDSVFLVFISLLCIFVLGIDIASMEKRVPPCYSCTCNIVPFRHYALCFVHYAPLDLYAWENVVEHYLG